MKKFYYYLVYLMIVVLFVSCSILPGRRSTTVIIPPVPELIMGQGILPPEDMAAFLLSVNLNIDADFVRELAVIYV